MDVPNLFENNALNSLLWNLLCIVFVTFTTRIFCRGVSSVVTGGLCGVCGREIMTRHLYTGPIVDESILNNLVCKFDRMETSFFLAHLPPSVAYMRQ